MHIPVHYVDLATLHGKRVLSAIGLGYLAGYVTDKIRTGPENKFGGLTVG